MCLQKSITIEIQQNIVPAFMASSNKLHNIQRVSESAYVYPRNISGPQMMPMIHHRASTGQINTVTSPATSLSASQTQYPQRGPW